MNLFEKSYWQQTFPAFRLYGSGTRCFLNGQTSADFLGAKSGDIIRSCWLSASGTINALLEVRLNNESADVIVLGGLINEIMESFERVIFPSDKVKVEPRKDIHRIQKLTSKTSWKNLSVLWLELEEKLPDEFHSLTNLQVNELEVWRIMQGLPISKNEINGKQNPFELGLTDLVSLNKGCYLGQEAMARIVRNDSLRQQLRIWRIKSIINKGLEVRNLIETPVFYSDNKIVGVITSAIKSSTNDILGLALIKKKYLSFQTLYILEDLIQIDLDIPCGFKKISDLA